MKLSHSDLAVPTSPEIDLFLVTGYRFLDDPSFTAEQYNLMEENIELRKVSNVLDNKDVRSRVLQKIEEIPTSIQVSNLLKSILFKIYNSSMNVL